MTAGVPTTSPAATTIHARRPAAHISKPAATAAAVTQPAGSGRCTYTSTSRLAALTATNGSAHGPSAAASITSLAAITPSTYRSELRLFPRKATSSGPAEALYTDRKYRTHPHSTN